MGKIIKKFTLLLTQSIFIPVRLNTKSMPKKVKNNRSLLVSLRSTPVLVFLSVSILLITASIFGFHAFAATCSTAADCQQQIANNGSQVAAGKQNLNQLSGQAQSYQQSISQLQSQIGSLQSQIQTNALTQASLEAQIAASKQQIIDQKNTLANDLKTLYVNGQITPIEMLATSNSISQYVDQQESYTAVQNKIEGTVNQIAALQQKLEAQKQQVDGIISTLQSQKSQLNYSEAQQSSLLSYNQAQQDQYNQQISAAESNISELNARLSALNDAGSSSVIASGACGGGYPAKALNPFYPSDGYGQYWGCDYSQDGSEDNWHMENRECVSYTAYMAYSKYGVSAKSWGNAYQWITSAESHGFVVDQNPKPGDIAIRNRDYSEAGDVGHAMYVVAVNGSDSITVNEYNEHYNGRYDERTFPPSSYASRGGLYFIHFQ